MGNGTLILLAALLSLPLRAQEADRPVATTDVAYASRRVFRGIERAGASAQIAGDFNQGDFHAGLWANQPFARDAAQEVDLNVAYTWRTANGASLEFSGIDYSFFRVPAGGTRYSWETGLTVSLPAMAGWTPSMSYFRDLRLDADTGQVAVTHRIALTGLGAFLHCRFFTGWSQGADWRPDAPGPRRTDGFGYWGAEAKVPYRIGLHTTLVAGVNFSDTFDRSAANGPDGRSTRANLGFTLGVDIDF